MKKAVRPEVMVQKPVQREATARERTGQETLRKEREVTVKVLMQAETAEKVQEPARMEAGPAATIQNRERTAAELMRVIAQEEPKTGNLQMAAAIRKPRMTALYRIRMK